MADQRYSVNAIKKMDSILQCIAEAEEPLSFVQIYSMLDLPKSSTYRLLETLSDLNYVRKTDGQRYTLGINLFRLGMIAGEKIDMRKAAHPVLVEVSKILGLTVSLAKINLDCQGVYIDRVEPRGIALNKTHMGDMVVMHCSCLGKVLLAWQEPEIMEKLVNEMTLTRHTPNSITDKALLIEDLKTARSRGYAVDNEELDQNIIGLGVPVFDSFHELVGAMSVGAVSTLITKDQYAEIIGVLQEKSRVISEHLIN